MDASTPLGMTLANHTAKYTVSISDVMLSGVEASILELLLFNIFLLFLERKKTLI